MKSFYLRLSTWAVLAATTIAVGVAPVSAQPSNKVDRAVRSALARGERTQRVIVTVQPGYRDTLRDALKNHGDVVKSEHALIEGIAADLHSADIEDLARQPWVNSIAADAKVHADAKPETSTGTTSSTLLTSPSQTLSNTLRQTLGLPAVANSDWPTGASGITVAVVDSGIAPSADFTGRITGFWDFTKGGVSATPFDDYGHGTHVAGLIGSNGKLSNYEFQGIAPDVHLVGLKVLDSAGAGYTSDVISALEFLTLNKSKLNLQIVNLSLGHPIYAPIKDDPLVQAVEKATAAGLIVVASAGNFGQKEKGSGVGYTGITSPGNAPSAITVGAAMTQDTVTRDDDLVAPYSSRGPTWFDALAKPDVVAPGHHLTSDTNVSSTLYHLLKTGQVKSKNGQDFLALSGSSMAAAVTSGVAALVIQAHNQNGLRRQKPISANLMKGILEFSAITIPGFDYLSQGAGEINAAGAIALGKAIDTSVKAGAWWLSTGVTPTTTIGGQSYPWGQTVVYGDVVLGGNIIYANNIIWGTNIVWGTADDGDNIIWGTGVIVKASNIVWGTNIIWGTNIVWGTRLIGQSDGGDNIIWGTLTGSNIVWGMRLQNGTILFATADGGDNIVWGTADQGDNIIWGTADGGDNIIWGTSDEGDNIVWGTVNGVF